MPLVSMQSEVEAPAARVWDALIDVERYPGTIEEVNAIEVVSEEGPASRTTAWEVTLKGPILKWVQREALDREALVLRFEQLTGDMAELDGRWAVEAIGDDRTRVRFEVSFEIGITLLADMLNPIAERALRDSWDGIMRGVGERALATA